jgi:hypothetical protein
MDAPEKGTKDQLEALFRRPSARVVRGHPVDVPADIAATSEIHGFFAGPRKRTLPAQ